MAKKKKEEPVPEENTEQAGQAEEAAAEGAAEETQGAAPAEETAAAGAANDANEKYLRLLAEYDNYRKRSVRERENIYADVRIDTVTRFLPVYDNLERALATPTADEAFRKGVEMTFNQLQEVMKKLGIEEIEAVGKTFDPTMHNAVMHVVDETLGENVIVEQFQKGFRLGEKIIRFSMVKVAN